MEEPGADIHSLSQAAWSPLSHTQEEVGASASAACCLATALESWSPLRPNNFRYTVPDCWSPPPIKETQQEQPKELPSPLQEIQADVEVGGSSVVIEKEDHGQESVEAAPAAAV